jgi:hypothetical protein
MAQVSNGYVTGSERASAMPINAVSRWFALPPHAYDYVQYDPVNAAIICSARARLLGPDVEAIAIPHVFNLDTLTWRHGHAIQLPF